MTLHFECGLKLSRCRYTHTGPNTTHKTSTRDFAKWIKLGFSLLKLGLAVFNQSPLDAVDACLDMYAKVSEKEDDNFKSYLSQPFLTSAEQDSLIQQLRDDRFFDVFCYYAYNQKWCCLRCTEDADTAKKTGIPATPFVKPDQQQIEQPNTQQPANTNGTPQQPTTAPNANPFASLDTPTKPPPKEISGLLKRKTDYFKQLKARYFVLNTTGLTYYKQKGDEHIYKSIPLIDLLNVKDADVRVTKHEFSFNLVTKKKTILLIANNEEDKKMWIAGFRQAIKEW